MAQSSGSEAVDIRHIHISAKGILVNSDDSMDIHSSKLISATFKPKGPEPLNSDKGLDRGIITFDKTKYTIKDVVATSTTFSANIYDKNLLIGSISLSFVDTPDVIVWAGKAKIKDVTYYAYYLQYSMVFIPFKQIENVKEYCKENPDAVGCNRVRNCEQNPSSDDCLPLWKEYCIKNVQDVRCKQYLKKLCEENPSLEFCAVQVDSKEAVFVTARIQEQGTSAPERVQACIKCKEECRQKCVPGLSSTEISVPVEAGKCLEECVKNCPPCYVVNTVSSTEAVKQTVEDDFCGRCHERCMGIKKICAEPYKCMSPEDAKKNACGIIGFSQTYDCPSDLACVKCPMTQRQCKSAPPLDPNFCANGKVTPKYDENGCIVGYDCITPQHCNCVAVYDPVCGSDGKTYGNSCEAECAGVKVMYKGKCGEPSKKCSYPYKCMTKEEIEINGCAIVSDYECPNVRICRDSTSDGGCYEQRYYCAKCPQTTPVTSPVQTQTPIKTPTAIPIPIPTQTTTQPECQYLYWFDNQNRTCGYKQFCGLYMYEGLRTFKTLKECEQALCSPYQCVAKSVAERNQCTLKGEVPCGYANDKEPKYCYSCGYVIQG